MLKRILYFIFPLLTLGLFLPSCDKISDVVYQDEKRDKLRAELKKMCDGLNPPAEFVRDDVYTGGIIKPDRGTYNYSYTGAISLDSVKEHYSNILLPQGWSLETQDIWNVVSGEKSTDLLFKKGKYLIRIACPNAYSPYPVKRFILSCSWSDNGY